jgi:TRAP-type C4-dicarboxylate transport system permease small subunit
MPFIDHIAATKELAVKNKLKSLRNYALKIHDHVSKGCFYVGAIMLMAIALTTSYDVTMRYFFTRPTVWANDFGKYFLCYSTFLAAAWILKLDGHVKVTIVAERLGPSARCVLNIANSMIGALACLILLWRGIIDTWGAFAKDILIIRPVVVPKWLILWIIPFGLILLCLYFIRNVFANLSELRSKRTSTR